MSELPRTGVVSYAGLATLNFADPGDRFFVRRTYAGQLDVSVDFAASQVTGQATGFSQSGGAAVDGVVHLSNGRIDRNAARNDQTVSMRMTGSLGDGPAVYTLSGQGAGDFSGSDAASLQGSVYGTVIQRGVTGVFDGTFRADR